MREYGFSLIHVLPYKGRIVDSLLCGRMRINENLYFRMFYAVKLTISKLNVLIIKVNCGKKNRGT